MRKVLITGGAGFIGTHLTSRLSTKGFDITVLDILSPQIHGEHPTYEAIEGVTFIKGDVRDKSLLISIIGEIDIVFHLASETGTGQSMYEIERYVSVNEVGTAILLEAIGEAGKKGIDFIQASSRSIYGEGAYSNTDGSLVLPSSRSSLQLSDGQWDFSDELGRKLEPIPTKESIPPSPGSIYAATKYSQEMLVSVAATALGMRLSTLRFQNVYGEGQSLRNPYTGIISIFYNRIRQGLPINVYEDGNESRDFVYIEDVVDALEACIERNNPESITANVGAGELTSVIDLANLISEVSGIESEITITGDYRIGDIRHCYADLNLARCTLGYIPKMTIEAGLKKFCNWAENEPEYTDKSESALSELQKKGLA